MNRMIKRAAMKAQSVSKKALAAGTAVVLGVQANAADIIIADPDYTNLWYAAGVMGGVLITFNVGGKVLSYFKK